MTNSEYDEYALQMVALILDYDVKDFQLKDKPDIQNDVDSIGVEVTRGIDSRRGWAQSIAQRYLGKRRKGKSSQEIKQIIEQNEAKFLVQGNVMFTSDEMLLVSPTHGSTNSSERLNCASDIIKVKSEKLKNYAQFERNCLYLFLETAIFSKCEIQVWLKEFFTEPVFDIIFIDCFNFIYFHDRNQFRTYQKSQNKIS